MTSAAAGRQLGLGRTMTTGVLATGAAVLAIALIAAIGSQRLAFDFRAAYLPAARAVVHGHSPYPSPDSAIIAEDRAYPYPPQLAVLLAPFTAFSDDVASVLAVLGALAALVGALAIVGVRDLRCYAAFLVWAPSWNSLEMANLSAVLALAAALVWRYRSTHWPLATTLGLAVSAKLFLWPLLVWTAASRRVRPTLAAVAIGLGTTIAAWAAIRFQGLAAYPDLLRRVSDVQSVQSYSFVGIAHSIGISVDVARALMLVGGGGLLVACAALARRGDDARAFTCAIVASLVLSPIVWQHYLVLLAIPLAIARPRFSALWLLPIVLWVSPRSGHGLGIQPFLPALVVLALFLMLVAYPRPAGRRVEHA
jgi:hypothetical protein